MPDRKNGFDKINAILAIFVVIFTFIIYRLTVQPTLSFWDCGEFIACSYILGIPHPPGSPLFVVIGRVFSVLPLAADICLRINLVSVVSSAATAMFGYLLTARIIRSWFSDNGNGDIWKRLTVYIGALTGSLFLAFSLTNWGNSVEAEVYGLAMMLMTAIFWLALVFYEKQGTPKGSRIMILMLYLGILGVAVHLTTFIIVPIAAIFLILKKETSDRIWAYICLFFIIELLLIILLSNIISDHLSAYKVFMFATVVLLGFLAFGLKVYKHINWGILIAIGALSMIMIGFNIFLLGLLFGAIVLALMGKFAPGKFAWKQGLIIIMIAVIGFSFHLFIPIRSAHNPRIDENNVVKEKFTLGFFMEPFKQVLGIDDVHSESSRNYRTFVDYLERKQYGSESMTERMFRRRGTMAHQFGRHAHMGFWSFFEEQYGIKGGFLIFFLLGLFGVYTAINRKLPVGLPFFTFLLLCSVGLILYMNFADGTMYSPRSGDAYLEVRNRDYFFTPAFMFFGLAMGLGIAAIMDLVRRKLSEEKLVSLKTPVMAALSLLILLPGITIASNWYYCDRSDNYYPLIYAHNILESCEDNAILFTSGDNDTFPLWCVQEVYEKRKDVTVINLSLLNTDWYIYQMKYQYEMPISLNEDQILWYPYQMQGETVTRPKEPFRDRPRKRMTYLIPLPHEGRIVKLQEMMVDEIVIENRWEKPVYGTSEPYAESPLKLRDYSYAVGQVYRIDKDQPERGIDADKGLELYDDVYRYDGLDNNNIFRDDNATGVFLSLGFNALRIANELRIQGRDDEAIALLESVVEKYPEFYQSSELLSEMYEARGDSAKGRQVMENLEQELTVLNEKNPGNQFYMMDLGMAKHHLGKSDEALDLMWGGFKINPNSSFAYRKLVQYLYDRQRMREILEATQMFADYKINRNDPLVQQILAGAVSPQEAP